MKYRDRGRKVRIAQMCLQKAGSNIEVNGYYSIGMISAVSKYQKDHNIEPTGKIDKKTWKVLRKEIPWFIRIFH